MSRPIPFIQFDAKTKRLTVSDEARKHLSGLKGSIKEYIVYNAGIESIIRSTIRNKKYAIVNTSIPIRGLGPRAQELRY